MSARQRSSMDNAVVVWAAIVGDIVHGAAEGIDLVHRIALFTRENAKGAIERAAGYDRLRGVTHKTSPFQAAHRRRPQREKSTSVVRAAQQALSPLLAPRSQKGTASKGAHARSRDPSSSAAPSVAAQFNNDARLETKPRVFDRKRQLRGFRQELGSFLGNRLQTRAQSGRGFGCAQFLDPCAKGPHRIERQVDAIERTIVLGAILQMIDDLQGGTERVGISPNGAILAVQVEHKTSDGHSGIAAIVYELVPIRIAALRHVIAKGGEKIERMRRGKTAIRQHQSEGQGCLGTIGFAEQRLLQGVKPCKFFALRESGMVGDVVGRAGKTVET